MASIYEVLFLIPLFIIGIGLFDKSKNRGSKIVLFGFAVFLGLLFKVFIYP